MTPYDRPTFRLSPDDTDWLAARGCVIPRASQWKVFTSCLWRFQVRCALPLNAIALDLARIALVRLANRRAEAVTIWDGREIRRIDREIGQWQACLAMLRQRRAWLRKEAGWGR
jgi:hypothetical protein